MAMRYAADTLDEATICSLERPAEAEDLSAAELAALEFRVPDEAGRVVPWGHSAVVDSTPAHLSQ